MLAAYNFLTHAALKSYTVMDTVDGFEINHTKTDGSKCRVIPKSDYLINGLDFLELILVHQMECGQ